MAAGDRRTATLLQAQYTDQLIGQTLQALETDGRFDESLIVITSDHGISFDVGTSRRDYVPGTVDSHAYSLLLVKEPGQTVGAIDDANLLSVDILPTVADILELPVPWDMDGHPAGSPAIADREGVKPFWDVTPIIAGAEFREVIEFDDATEFPDVSDRWVGTISPDDDPVAALLRRLGSYDLIGQATDQLTTASEVDGELTDPNSLAEPPTPPLAFVQGGVVSAPDDAEVLVAVDGVIISGSPLYDDGELTGRFQAILPASHLGRPLEPELFLWSPDGELARISLA